MASAGAPGAARLLVFARPPVLGRIKTRLAATLGPEAALAIYRRLLAITQQAVAAAAVPATVWLAEAPPAGPLADANTAAALPEWPGLPWRIQAPALDLGERMAAAFAVTFAEGAGRVAVIGTDCPGLTAEILMQAINGLAAHDVMIGPAADGGYYLLALRRPCPELFQNIAWSSASVLADTLALAAGLGLLVGLLPTLHDVDTADDLAHWERAPRAVKNKELGLTHR